MKAFVHRLFSQNNSDLSIGLFDVWHFTYLAIIFGGAALLSFLLHTKSEATRTRAVKFFSALTIGLYVADFFIMPLSDSYSFSIGIDKLPFHICTFVGVLAAFVQFSPRFEKYKSTVVCLAIASSMMWMCYPGNALGGQPPFCYIIFQTFMYHGSLFTWGILSLTLSQTRLCFKGMWRELIVTLFIMCWATLGNTIYPNEQNWFFVSRSIFPFLPDKVMPIASVLSVMGVCLIIHTVYHVASMLIKRRVERLCHES